MMLSGRLEEGYRTQIKSDGLQLANAGATYFHLFRIFLWPTNAPTKSPRINPPGPKTNMPHNGPKFASEPTRKVISIGPKNPTTNPMLPSNRAVQAANARIMANRFSCSIYYSLEPASSVIVGLL